LFIYTAFYSINQIVQAFIFLLIKAKVFAHTNNIFGIVLKTVKTIYSL